jgi:spore germination protein YaaH
MPSTADEDFSLGYWLAYWDMDSGLKEFKKVKDDASSVSYFAAYFDSSDKIFIPAEVREAKKKTKSDASTYLTIVNDKMWKNGKFTEKDLGVLRRVFADGVVMNRHVDDLIELAKDNGYDGLEIDYEQIWKDKDLRANYLHFLEILNRRAQSQNLKLRVVLEPSVDFSAGFPDGPQYVVMMYNLFGTHSGPGPKANEKFILSVLQRMMYLPGEKAVAFSTGGCSWKDGSRGIFIDEAQAVKTAKGHSVVPKRDGDSAALYYDYTDGGKRVTVWYADKDTLNAWITVAKNYGINHVSLWRLGSNTDIHGVKVP